MPVNAYASALQVDPQREQQELIKLKSNPQKMAELGLSPTEDFSALKNDPAKYNTVLSYVKGQVYGSPAYSALASGQLKPDFVASQVGPDYSQTPTERTIANDPALQTKFDLPALGANYRTLDAQSYSAPTDIRNRIEQQGGYNIEGLKTDFEKQRADYANAYRRFVNGEISGGEYAGIVSNLSTSARTLDKAKTDLNNETNTAMGTFNSNLARAKNAYQDALDRLNTAEKLDQQGYAEARGEKMKAAQDAYDAGKALLDETKKETDKYQEAQGKIYNPTTGKYELKPIKATSDDAEIKAFQKDAADLIKELDNPDVTKRIAWGTAYDALKAKYPRATPDTINSILGGGIPYNPQTGFDAKNAYGRARLAAPTK